MALARIKAAELEAGADLLNGLAAFWRGIGMSTRALREHDPAELMPLFERYAEKQFDAEAKELLACFPDPEAYSLKLILLPMKVAMRVCPSTAIVLPEDFTATEWTDLYRTLKAARAHGPVHARLPRRAQRLLNDTALRSPEAHAVREAIERARNGQSGGAKPAPPTADTANAA